MKSRLACILLIVSFAGIKSFSNINSNINETIDNQADERIDSISILESETTVNIADFPFIKIDANHIILNGANWDGLRNKLQNINHDIFTVVHIGDSHIQADVSTDRVRSHFQERFGNAGRGLVTPLKIAGTNEPFNYRFSTDSKVVSAKLMKQPWSTDMGFTGVSFSPQSDSYSISFSTEVKRNPDGIPFDKIRLYSVGEQQVTEITDDEGNSIDYSLNLNDSYTEIILNQAVITANISFKCDEPVTIYGAELNNGENGVRYHAIGNNGATFSSYNRLMSMGNDIAMLSPDLAIISLGTNEAFGKVSDEALYAEIDYMIRDITKNNPGVEILLTTPMECQKSTRKTRRNKRGRLYTTRTYTINENIKRLRNVILFYGKKNHVPVYDWFDIAGGEGASNLWLENKLMNTDRIHDTFTGYKLSGDLLYSALLDALISEPLTIKTTN